MKVGFKGFNEQVLTFLASEEIKAGSPVKIADTGLICAAAADEEFAGVATQGGTDFAPVLITGYTELSCSSSAVKCGWQYLAADGSGGVKTAASGKAARLVVKVDSADKKIGVII